MTSIITTEVEEQLLETYPFSKSQLHLLLSYFNNDRGTGDVSSVEHQNSKDDEKKKQRIRISAFDWIENHLILPYYPKREEEDWLHQLIQSGTKHNSSKLRMTRNDETNNNTHDGSKEQGQKQEMHLFLDTMAKLSGRKDGGSSWEIKVFYTFLVNIMPSSSNDDDAGDDDEKKVMDDELQCEVMAKDFITLAYRLALGCHVIQNWQTLYKNEKGTEGSTTTTTTTSATATPNEGTITSKSDTTCDLNQIIKLGQQSSPSEMIKSLHSFKSSQGSVTTGMMYMDFDNHDDNYTKDDTFSIDFNTFHNWLEINFPQMSCILSSFVHLMFFTSHDVPYVDHDDPTNNEVNDHNDSDESTSMTPVTNLYALGRRRIFEFPSLEKVVNLSSSERESWLSSTPVSSILFSDTNRSDDNNFGGTVGHFAFGIACIDPTLCGKWHRVYSTETDGFAFLNFQKAITGYNGPSILIIRPTKTSAFSDGNNNGNNVQSPGLFGFYTNNTWKESTKYYGSSDCCLFRAEPCWNIYRPTSLIESLNQISIGDSTTTSQIESPSFPPTRTKDTENFMHFYPSTYDNATNKNKPHGLFLGGTEDQPRFHLTETLEQCVASNGGMVDKTFECGPLLPGQWDKYYNVDVLEIWGVGGDSSIHNALTARQDKADLADATRRRMQMVDKRQFLEDFQEGTFKGGSSSNLFEHRTDGRVRHDFSTGMKD